MSVIKTISDIRNDLRKIGEYTFGVEGCLQASLVDLCDTLEHRLAVLEWADDGALLSVIDHILHPHLATYEREKVVNAIMAAIRNHGRS